MTPHIAAAAKRMIDAGERFDVVILSPAVVDELIRENKVDGTTRVDIIRAGIGVAVRAGEPKPDISSVAALRSTLRTATEVSDQPGCVPAIRAKGQQPLAAWISTQWAKPEPIQAASCF